MVIKCKCQQVSKEKNARMNLKTIKFYALCLNTNEVIFVCFSLLCFLVVKKLHREYKEKSSTEDISFILNISYEKKR